MRATCKIIIDRRREKKLTQTYPLKLSVRHDRITSLFTTVYHLTENDYKKLYRNNINIKLQAIRSDIKEIIRTVENFIEIKERFSLTEFRQEYLAGHPMFKERMSHQKDQENARENTSFNLAPYIKRFPIFLEDRSNPRSLSSLFATYIQRFLSQNRIGTAMNLQSSYFSLKFFRDNCLLSRITTSYLYEYERWMLARGQSISTAGITTRNLRTIYYLAIEKGMAYKADCPFGKYKYMPPKSTGFKRALTSKDLARIYHYTTTDPTTKKAKDFWLFCYFTNGMSPKDLLGLKFKNIEGDFITYHRAKTIFTSRPNLKLIKVVVNEEMKQIIDKWGNEDKESSNYIFPILNDLMSSLEIHYQIRSFIRFVNDRMKRIGKELGIETKLTTMVSRHSFATQLKRSGISTKFIQEALGYADKSTTECYLDSFDEMEKERASEYLNFRTIDLIHSAS